MRTSLSKTAENGHCGWECYPTKSAVGREMLKPTKPAVCSLGVTKLGLCSDLEGEGAITEHSPYVPPLQVTPVLPPEVCHP